MLTLPVLLLFGGLAVLVEAVAALVIYEPLRRRAAAVRWPTLE